MSNSLTYVYCVACLCRFFLFACFLVRDLHRHTGNFLPRGAVNHLPKKFLQVAQIFTKQSKRNEGHTMQQHRPYWHMKVAWYSFSGSIPAKFEHKLRRHKHLEKLPPQLCQIKMKICYDQGCNDIGVVIATKWHPSLLYMQHFFSLGTVLTK